MHYLFITGKLAERNLSKVLDTIKDRDFTYEIRCININVAALLTTELLSKKIDSVQGFDKIILPGKVRGDIAALEKSLGVKVERGPEELKDLPAMFGGESLKYDLTSYEVHIFAEITDAPFLSIPDILILAESYRRDGAEIIDIGCLPNQPFPHLSETIQELKKNKFYVSVDSHNLEEIVEGSKSGADYVLSLKKENINIIESIDATPVLIPNSTDDIDSLYWCIDKCIKENRKFIADPILDPINYGFTNSLVRYHQLRKDYPKIDIMMGIGNLTELTHADTTGITAMLMGIITELKINHILTAQVSNHCRTVIKETDLARRIMYAASSNNITPKHINPGLLVNHASDKNMMDKADIDHLYKQVKDKNYRIIMSDDGIHLFNKKGKIVATDPYDFYDFIDVEGDIGHAYYLGIELARAQIAYQLGKDYEQDEELDWGCLVNKEFDDKLEFKETRSTYKKKKNEGT